MTVEQGEAEAVVRIRASRRAWIWRFVSAGAWLAFAAGFLLIDRLPLAALGSLVSVAPGLRRRCGSGKWALT
jgi:hypothetical protein